MRLRLMAGAGLNDVVMVLRKMFLLFGVYIKDSY